MIPTIASILSTAKDLENLFGSVRCKLLNYPAAASAKVTEVLGELRLRLECVEKESVRSLDFYFLDDKSNFIQCRSALLSLETSDVIIKGYEVRGHCHTICNAYEKYVDRGFSTRLSAREAQQIKGLFGEMDTVDGDRIEGIQEMTRQLKDETEAVLLWVEDSKRAEANTKITSARLPIQQTSRDIEEALAALIVLQARFIVSSQTDY